MLQQYISQCGQEVNSDPTEVFLDHHLAVVLNRDYREQLLVNTSGDNWNKSHEYDLPISQNMDDSGLGDIYFEVLTDMCKGELLYNPTVKYALESIYYNRSLIINLSTLQTKQTYVYYIVFNQLILESVIPTGSVNLVTTHICPNGTTISNHCTSQTSSGCNDDETSKKLECEYYNSCEPAKCHFSGFSKRLMKIPMLRWH